jgi:hypothetical protein
MYLNVVIVNENGKFQGLEKCFFVKKFLHVAETWPWTEADVSRQTAVEMRFLRSIESRIRKGRIRNKQRKKQSVDKYIGRKINK